MERERAAAVAKGAHYSETAKYKRLRTTSMATVTELDDLDIEKETHYCGRVPTIAQSNTIRYCCNMRNKCRGTRSTKYSTIEC
jgi:hypothetical protein